MQRLCHDPATVGDSGLDGGSHPGHRRGPGRVESVTSEVRSGYGQPYEVLSHSSSQEALTALAERASIRVAAALAALWTSTTTLKPSTRWRAPCGP